MSRASANRNGHLDHLETEVSEVTSLLKDNVEKLIDRGERIDSLQNRSEDLEGSTINFKKSSVRLKKRMCMNNFKLTCIIIIVVLAIIGIIVGIVLAETKPWESSSHSKGNGTGLADIRDR